MQFLASHDKGDVSRSMNSIVSISFYAYRAYTRTTISMGGRMLQDYCNYRLVVKCECTYRLLSYYAYAAYTRTTISMDGLQKYCNYRLVVKCEYHKSGGIT